MIPHQHALLCAAAAAELASGGRKSDEGVLTYNYSSKPFSLTVRRGGEALFAIEASRFIFKARCISVSIRVSPSFTVVTPKQDAAVLAMGVACAYPI